MFDMYNGFGSTFFVRDGKMRGQTGTKGVTAMN